MKTRQLLRIAVAGAILGGAGLMSAVPVSATTTGPTVIAVHRDGAVDVSGSSTLATVAKLSVPIGNWSLMATATVVGTDVTNTVYCQLVAGAEYNQVQTLPTATGTASSQSIVLLLAHHFTKAGTVSLKCDSDGWTGDVLIRDIHVTAVQVGQLTDNSTTTGTGSPRAAYAQSGHFDLLGTSATDLQDLAVPAGNWLVRANLWAYTLGGGDRMDCSLVSGITTAADSSFMSAGSVSAFRTISMEGVFDIASSTNLSIKCQSSASGWIVEGTAISAIQVGTIKYGPFGGTQVTVGTGSPTVIGGNGGPGGILDFTTLSSVGSLSLGAGSWLVTSKLSVQGGGATPKITCQLKVSSGASQARVILDGGNDIYAWMAMSLTKKLTAAANASVACNQSAGALGAIYADLKIFALKVGTLTDTAL